MHKKRKSSGIHVSSRKPTKKVCDENESRIRIRKKQHARRSIIHGRKPFIIPKQKTSLHELLGNDCGYNEGTIMCSERVNKC